MFSNLEVGDEINVDILNNSLKNIYLTKYFKSVSAYNKNVIVEIKVEYNILEFKFNQHVKRYLIDTGYQQFKEQYVELFGDTHSSETSKSDIKSTKENLDEIIEDMNREIKVINEKNETVAVIITK